MPNDPAQCLTPPETVLEAEVVRIESLLARAHKGDASCVPDLRALFQDPAMEGLMRAYGSPPETLRRALVDAASGTNLVVREASTQMLANVREDLEGANASPLEVLLAERAALCWWIVNRYEAEYASKRNLSTAQSDSDQKRIDRAHNRFLSALKTLATVRKLAIPSLQVNIGTHQINTLAAGGEV